MRFWLKNGILTTIAGIILVVAAAPISAQFTVPTVPTVPRMPSSANFTTNTSGVRLTPAAPGFPVTTFASGGSNLLLAPLYRAGINPFGNYGNWPLYYSPYGGYSSLYSGYPMYGNTGTGTININVPSSSPGAGYQAPTYPSSYGGGYNPYLSAGSGLSSGTYASHSNPYLPNYSAASLVNAAAGIQSIDYRRRLWDEARYERMTQTDPEPRRPSSLPTAPDRARHDPSLNEILSGQSLNDLFNHLKTEQGKDLKRPTISLTEDMLRHINLMTGKNGNAGLLKSDIKWPTPLLRSEFEEPRTNLDTNILEALRQAKFGPVNANVANNVLNDVQKMHDLLLKNISDIRPGEYMEAKAYLSKLNQAARALQDRDVTNYFNGEWTAKGKTVGELVKNMSEKGLQFAAAAPGDEWAYRSFYNALAAYDAGLAEVASATAKEP